MEVPPESPCFLTMMDDHSFNKHLLSIHTTPETGATVTKEMSIILALRAPWTE